MAPIVDLPLTDWNQVVPAEVQQGAIDALENGNVLFFPQLPFALDESEQRFLTPSTVSKSKNVSYDIASGTLRGTSLSGTDAQQLQAMAHRFASYSHALVLNLLPHYKPAIIRGRTSFRPVEVSGRTSSWRKDDTRLHVDSFPSAPVQDKRILRVFSNIHPGGGNRTWRLGEPFEKVANRFMPSISAPLWGSSQLLELLHITKSRRSAYDHFMLQLHDSMKADMNYQARVEQVTYHFPPGSTWIVYTDQVSHAAMSGQHLLEQTFYLPVTAMADPLRSPLRILERMTERTLT